MRESLSSAASSKNDEPDSGERSGLTQAPDLTKTRALYEALMRHALGMANAYRKWLEEHKEV